MALTFLNHSLHLCLSSIVLAGIGIRLFSIRRLMVLPSEHSRLRDFVIGSALFRHGLAVLLLTGIGRLLLPGEKGWAYDFRHPAFHAKLTIFFILYLLEMKPLWLTREMKRLTRAQEDLSPLVQRAIGLKGISLVQTLGLLAMIPLAIMTALNLS
jgi:uncharacterized membrane protein